MIRWFIAFLLWANLAMAQVTVDPDRSEISDGWRSLQVTLGLSEITPYRVFTLDAPRRLVIDFKYLGFGALSATDLLQVGRASGVRFGPLRPDWARMVIDLAEPMVIDQAGLTRSQAGAELLIVLTPASETAFAAAAGPPPDPGWEMTLDFDPLIAAQIAQSADFVVVLDPGHGGIDPGALQGGIKEADLMLILAEELAVTLNQTDGLRAVLTRQGDAFVPLSARLTMARQVGADMFISLHADALDTDAAQGATVYTLAKDGAEDAARRIVERHERGDLLAGVDLGGGGDRVATALMDLARAQTGPQGVRFADALVGALARTGVRLNSNPRREGQFAVLTAADFPSVLIEVGFLSNPEDRAFLASAQGRAQIARAIRETLILQAQ